jgi:ribonuclease HI
VDAAPGNTLATLEAEPTMNNVITIHFDGLNEPSNPGGWACWAWIAFGPDGRVLRSDSGCLGHGPDTTNNQAEYEALIQALTYTCQRTDMLRERQIRLCIRGDSQLVIKQVSGEWRTNAAHLVALRDLAQAFIQQIEKSGVPLTLEWIPRELNEEADALSRKAYAAARKDRRYATA